jgi:hypothetical protein
MSIARVFDGKGWTLRDYDALIAKMDLGGKTAPGVLYHVAGLTADGMRAIDVYESREAADRLAQERIAPLAQALGLPLPSVAEFDVHAILMP